MFILPLLAYAVTVSAYIWPSPKLDALEAMRWEQDTTGFAVFFQFCSSFIFGNANGTPTGRANAPDWLRTAYHDMATHNFEDGTGGLDASIRFPEEQSRAEVRPKLFKVCALPTIHLPTYLPQNPVADLIAIGAITAVETCGGPQIPLRGGRIDSAKPNTPGVPEPQKDLQSHIAALARQGFTQTEMIGLIACGCLIVLRHTFGGVQHKPFPQIVPDMNDPKNTQSVAHFDSTLVHFDNSIAKEYIAGTTQNPLVVGNNHTTRSDERIFNSDGNSTMQSFAESPTLFVATCASLFRRMLDTVPSGVELTEVIEPLPVKPTRIVLLLDGDKLKLSGSVRLWGLAEVSTRHVHLLWDDHLGHTRNASLKTDLVAATSIS
ncbi:heme peroxidase [Mycena capillaripes]|nr:heme peroxidase [Mycena capillaripes]